MNLNYGKDKFKVVSNPTNEYKKERKGMSKIDKDKYPKKAALDNLRSRMCSTLVKALVNQQAHKLASGSTQTHAVDGMTLKFADGSKVFVENFWKGNYAELGCFMKDFFLMCEQTHDECSHEKRTDGIVTL